MNVTAQRLNEAMSRHGIDQSELARAVGVTQGAISKIALGKTANSRLLPKIATELGVPLSWLIGRSDSPDETNVSPAFSFQERDWVNTLRCLDPLDRAAIIRLTSTLGSIERIGTLHSPALDYRAEG